MDPELLQVGTAVSAVLPVVTQNGLEWKVVSPEKTIFLYTVRQLNPVHSLTLYFLIYF